MTGWQPIETAPKDGSYILLLIDDTAIEGNWYVDFGYPKGKWSVAQLSSHGCGCCGSEDSPPTHWMPRPPMPTKE